MGRPTIYMIIPDVGWDYPLLERPYWKYKYKDELAAFRRIGYATINKDGCTKKELINILRQNDTYGVVIATHGYEYSFHLDLPESTKKARERVGSDELSHPIFANQLPPKEEVSRNLHFFGIVACINSRFMGDLAKRLGLSKQNIYGSLMDKKGETGFEYIEDVLRKSINAVPKSFAPIDAGTSGPTDAGIPSGGVSNTFEGGDSYPELDRDKIENLHTTARTFTTGAQTTDVADNGLLPSKSERLSIPPHGAVDLDTDGDKLPDQTQPVQPDVYRFDDGLLPSKSEGSSIPPRGAVEVDTDGDKLPDQTQPAQPDVYQFDEGLLPSKSEGSAIPPRGAVDVDTDGDKLPDQTQPAQPDVYQFDATGVEDEGRSWFDDAQIQDQPLQQSQPFQSYGPFGNQPPISHPWPDDPEPDDPGPDAPPPGWGGSR